MKAYEPEFILPKDGLQGHALVQIDTIQLKKGIFGEKWIYKCQIKNWLSPAFSDTIRLNLRASLPCLIFLPKEKAGSASRPLADQDYWVSGKLILLSNGGYVFKPSSKAIWTPIEGSRSIAEKRYKWKKSISHWIKKQFPHKMSADFLTGLATGEFDNPAIKQDFGRFGLQHILAISGVSILP